MCLQLRVYVYIPLQEDKTEAVELRAHVERVQNDLENESHDAEDYCSRPTCEVYTDM